MVAEQPGIANRAITNTMALDARHRRRGRAVNELHGNSPTLLTKKKVEQIKQWREAHPRGRSKAELQF